MFKVKDGFPLKETVKLGLKDWVGRHRWRGQGRRFEMEGPAFARLSILQRLPRWCLGRPLASLE